MERLWLFNAGIGPRESSESSRIDSPGTAEIGLE